MNLLRATIQLADLVKEVKIGYFSDDTKDDFLLRYSRRLSDGVEGAILSRLIRYANDDDSGSAMHLCVQLEPFGWYKEACDNVEIKSIQDLSSQLSNLSMIVIEKKKKMDRGE